MWANILLSVLITALCLKANAYQTYQGNIPNGANVPNPCNRSSTWPGVGHQATFGSGPRNPFGLDFDANNHVWNQTLCQKDSDGDGRTNGQELGDPNCVWVMGSSTPFSTNLSHPGICEPISSPLCLGTNSWLMGCSTRKLDCPAIRATGVKNETLQFPVTPIPNTETTYICHRFNLPNDSVADIIAIEPVIDNAPILHHMMLFACTVPPSDYPANETFDCGMVTQKACRSILGIFVVGAVGQCLNSQLGFRIGPGGFQYAVIKLHWNNPQNMANLTDSSGMRIYYTTQLRPNRGEVAGIAQVSFVIPPGQPTVTFTGSCSSQCTRHFPQSIFLTSAYLHMHTLGKSGDLRLSRNGQTVQVLDNVTQYDYNTPTFLEYDTPIEVKPGDEIQVKCVYDSTTRNSTTYSGAATSDEMCIGYLAYYPGIDGLGYCGQWKSINVFYGSYGNEFGSCDFSTFKTLLALLPSVCNGNCTSTPCAVIMDGMLSTGCQNYPDVLAYTYGDGISATLFQQCAMERQSKPPSTAQHPSTTQHPVSYSTGQPSASQGVSLYYGFVITLLAYANCV